jgi:hypothetical protein
VVLIVIFYTIVVPFAALKRRGGVGLARRGWIDRTSSRQRPRVRGSPSAGDGALVLDLFESAGMVAALLFIAGWPLRRLLRPHRQTIRDLEPFQYPIY